MNVKLAALLSILILAFPVIFGLGGAEAGPGTNTDQRWATRTPEPTLTSTQQEDFQADILDRLRSGFGFDHPLFEELAESYTLSSPEYIRRLQGSFKLTTATTWFADQRYVVGNMPGSVLGSRYLEFFRVDKQGTVTLLNPALSRPKGYSIVWLTDLNVMPESDRIVSDGFADRNHNLLPDLPLYWETGGNCCPRYMMLLELNPQGEFIDITPGYTDVFPAYFSDLDQNGVWEIQGVRPVPIPIGGVRAFWPDLIRWFAWDGSQYVEVTSQYQDWYLSRVEPLLDYLSQRDFCILLPVLQFSNEINIYQALLDYAVIGRLEEGWTEIQRRSNWRECKPQLALQYETEIILFEDWLLSLPSLAMFRAIDGPSER